MNDRAEMDTFAKDFLGQRSGLPVARHEAGSIHAELGPQFNLVEQFHGNHAARWDIEINSPAGHEQGLLPRLCCVNTTVSLIGKRHINSSLAKP
jgi:hypothetical protein